MLFLLIFKIYRIYRIDFILENNSFLLFEFLNIIQSNISFITGGHLTLT